MRQFLRFDMNKESTDAMKRQSLMVFELRSMVKQSKYLSLFTRSPGLSSSIAARSIAKTRRFSV